MRRIDDWLIDGVFQPIADALACIASCYAIAAFLLTGFGLEHVAFYIFREDYLFILVTSVWLGPLILRAYRLENEPVRDVLSVERIQQLWVRVLNVFCLLPICLVGFLAVDRDLLSILDEVGWISMMIAQYFMACRRNPPKKRRALAPWKAALAGSSS